MDLKKVRRFDYDIQFTLSDDDLRILEHVGMIFGPSSYFEDSKTFVDLCHSAYANKVYIHVGTSNEEEDRILYKVQVQMMDGTCFEKQFWSHGIINIMDLEVIRNLKEPRKISVKVIGGIYEGSGTPDEWMNVLTTIEDFTPVVCQSTDHTVAMDDLLNTGRFSDLKLVCKDGREIDVHKCLMLACPYFRALLSENFPQVNTRFVEVEFEYSLMKVIVQFIYSGRIEEDNVTNWPELYIIASFFCLETLARHCQLQMMMRSSIDINEVKSLLKFGLRFHARKLITFLAHKARKIQNSSCLVD